jgi:phospholipid/cholesterol/gamma-HCH transport system substrate-binding protein
MSNEAKLGILATIAILVSIFGYKFLKGQNVFSISNEYYVEYLDVQQLTKSSPIFINGLKVGSVKDIYLKPEDLRTIIVVLDIKSSIKIPKNTIAAIQSTGLVGGKVITLQYKGVCTDGTCAVDGDYLKGVTLGLLDVMVGHDQLNDYMEQVKTGLVGIVDTLSGSVGDPNSNTVIAKSVRDIQVILENLKATTNDLKRISDASAATLPKTLNNIDALVANLKNNNDKINSIIANTASFSDKINKTDIDGTNKQLQTTLAELKNTISQSTNTVAELNKITKEINSGNGSLGKLIYDPQLYTNLNKTSKNMELLLQDFRLNPKRYVNVSVFGKKQKTYVVPANDPAFQDSTQFKN